jgi:DNA mismatch repair protein MutS
MYEEYIRQWRSFVKQYGSKTALFLMVGKFYELYDILDGMGEGETNVRSAVEILGITLTTRKGDGPQGQDCLFAGFPEQSLQKFAALLTREGWTVVVCDQEKNTKGVVTGRPVSRIFSPGTHVETAGADAPYLAGVWLQESADVEMPPCLAVSVLDLTTGNLKSYEKPPKGTADIWSADDVVHFFQVHPPRETIVWWRGSSFSMPSEQTLRKRLGIVKGTVTCFHATKEQQGFLEIPNVRKELFERMFHPKSMISILQYLNLEKNSYTERLLASLLRFAEDHLASAVQHLDSHQAWNPESSVFLGNNSLTQLNYIPSGQAGQDETVLTMFQECITSMGKRAIRERLLYPYARLEDIRKHLADVEYCYGLEGNLQRALESSLRSIYDIARLHRKVSMCSVSAADVLALDQSYGAARNLEILLAGTHLSFGEENRDALIEFQGLFQEYFPPEKAKMAMANQDISFLSEEKAPETGDIEKKLAKYKKQAMSWMEILRTWVGLPEEALKLESLETQSYYFSGTKTTMGYISKKLAESPKDQYPIPGLEVTNKKTGRGSVTSESLEQLHYQVLGGRAQLQASIKKELPGICFSLHDSGKQLWRNLESWIAKLDVSLCLARIAKKRGYCKPEILDFSEDSPSSGVEAIGLRHPLLENIATRIEYVKHDVSLGFHEDEEEGWLVYGMNASGKSSLMKAVGIAVLLAQSGSYVPAEHFRLRPFRSILTRILNQDNLWAGLSSFAVEMTELRDIFTRADHRSLVLGDELCSGTENISATSLVAAGIDWLLERKARFMFATHLHGLLEIPEITEKKNLAIWHLRVHYDAASDKLIYDRRLHRGPGGTLYGIEVAKAMSLPTTFLHKAMEIRRALLGIEVEETASMSQWNRGIQRKECEICHSKIARDLEVHHIKPRKDAISGQRHFKDGMAVHSLQNLVVVCQVCHDKHHAGILEIGNLQQTSEGVSRRSSETTAPTIGTKYTKGSSKWSEEEEKIIEIYLRKYPNVSLNRIKFDLKQEKEIEISESALRKIRSSLM